MAFRRIGSAVALATALTIAAPLVASAQGRGGGPPLFTPAADASEVGALQLGVAHGHAAGRRGTRARGVARVSG